MSPLEARRLVGHPDAVAPAAESPAASDIVERLREQALEMYEFNDHELMREAADEIERLRERLEMAHAWQMVDGEMRRVAVPPGSIPDGIECRDETIRLQDQELERLRSIIDRTRSALLQAKCQTDSHWAAAIIERALKEEA